MTRRAFRSRTTPCQRTRRARPFYDKGSDACRARQEPGLPRRTRAGDGSRRARKRTVTGTSRGRSRWCAPPTSTTRTRAPRGSSRDETPCGARGGTAPTVSAEVSSSLSGRRTSALKSESPLRTAETDRQRVQRTQQGMSRPRAAPREEPRHRPPRFPCQPRACYSSQGWL